ncbi:MAG TPA: hypothetical protein VFD26_03265, partial [Methyloceanibacter sp.]|nr:hypothetical protein [Methyloceanibacter sp.]
MRFICVFMIGLVALSSVGIAQSLPSGPNRGFKGWSKPGGPSVGPRGPSIKPGGPSIFIPPITGRSCPEGTTGKWPKCRAPDEPDVAAKPCPDGHVRKGKKCVELTKDEGGKKPPRVVKT